MHKKDDIVLVNPPFSLKDNFGLLDFAGQYGPPLNVLYLASSLEKEGINTRVVDLSYEPKTLEECAKYIASFNSEFIGVAIHFTFLVNKSLKLITLIKRLNPNVTIIVGGVHFTSLPEETMNACPEVDVGILGEADEAIVEVIRSIKGNKPLSHINGVIFREGNEFIKIGSSNLIDNVNESPPFLFNKINIHLYSPALYKEKKNRNFPIITSRGCPFECSFCDRTVLGKKIRFYDIDYLSNMIDTLAEEFNVDCLDVEDENIYINEGRLDDICSLMKEKFLKHNITWNCSVRVDKMDSYTAKRLYNSGCRSMTFGIESASHKMLDVYNKKLSINTDDIVKRCKVVRNAGISLAGSFIIGGPQEDEKSILDTINLVKRIDLDYMYLWYFAPYPGAAIYRNIEDQGRLVGDYSNRTGQHISFIPNALSREQLEAGYKRIYKAFYSRPKVIFRIINKFGPAGIPKLFKNGIKYVHHFVLNAD